MKRNIVDKRTMTYQKGLIFRKLIHLSTGLMILILSFVVEKSVLLYLILAGSIFSFLTFNHKKFHILHKSAEESLDYIIPCNWYNIILPDLVATCKPIPIINTIIK